MPKLTTMNKRNFYLEISGDEQDDSASLSEREDAQHSRLSSLRFKRRRLSDSVESDSHSADSGGGDRLSNTAARDAKGTAQLNDQYDHVNTSGEQPGSPNETSRRLLTKSEDRSTSEDRKVLTKAKLEKAQRKIRKTGVVYISRIPPFMKPSTLRQLLSPYGVLLRTFLTPEPAPRYQARVRAGGNKKKSFVDGWVEFESKKRAKICAEALNGNIVGGKKGGFYHDDLWNIKYLKGFKWNDLMEQVQGEERERDGKLHAEIERERRERKLFLRNAERAKIERGMDAKRSRHNVKSTAVRDPDEDPPPNSTFMKSKAQHGKSVMLFKQNLVRNREDTIALERKPDQQALRKIF